jgi:hypothetical protein
MNAERQYTFRNGYRRARSTAFEYGWTCPTCSSPKSPQALRCIAADNLWRRSGNLTMAQQFLRHESPATTARYLHPTRDDLEAALQALDE